MKKIYKPLIMLMSMSLFLLGSCGSTNNGGKNEDSSDKPTDETPYNPPIDDNPGKEDDEGGEDNKPTVKEGTILYRSYQLAENVEKIPSAQEVYGVSDSQSNVKKIREINVSDETNPSDEVLEVPAYRAYYNELWNGIDGQISYAKYIKDFVITNIYCLDTWVKQNEYTCYRLNYDVNKDAAIIEIVESNESDDRYSYSNIYTTYDEQGRMLIDYVNYYFYIQNNEMMVISKSTISYVENLYWDFTCYEWQDDFGDYGIIFNYVIHANLAKEETEITQISSSQVLNEDGSAQITDNRASIQSAYGHLTSVNEATINGIETSIYDKDGYNYFHGVSNKDDNGANISIPLYRLSGYSKIENRYIDNDFYNGERYLTVGEETYRGERYNYQGVEWYVSSMVSGISVEPAISFYLNYSKYNENETVSLIKGLLSSIGLSFKEDYLSEAIHLEYCKKQICEQREAFGKKNFLEISKDEFDVIYEHYDIGYYDIDMLNEYKNAVKIDIDKQVQDDGYYSLINSASSGSYSFNKENEKINISEININVTKNVLLNKDTDYVGVLALKSGRNIVVVKESDTIHFDGANDINVTIDEASFDIKDLPADNDESFELVAYLAIKKGETLSRCSNVSSIAYADEDYTHLISEFNSYENSGDYHFDGQGPVEYQILKEFVSFTKNGDTTLIKHYFTTEPIPTSIINFDIRFDVEKSEELEGKAVYLVGDFTNWEISAAYKLSKYKYSGTWYDNLILPTGDSYKIIIADNDNPTLDDAIIEMQDEQEHIRVVGEENNVTIYDWEIGNEENIDNEQVN